MFQDPLFVREDYLGFAADPEAVLQEIEEPYELRLHHVVPDIAQAVIVLRADVVQNIKEHSQRQTRKLDTLTGRMENFFEGRFSVALHAPSTTLPAPESRAVEAVVRPALAPYTLMGQPGPSYDIQPNPITTVAVAAPPAIESGTQLLKFNPANPFTGRLAQSQRSQTFTGNGRTAWALAQPYGSWKKFIVRLSGQRNRNGSSLGVVR